MTGKLMRTALRRSQTQIRHVSAVRPSAATGLVADVYARVEQDFGMLAPPVSLHSPAPEPLAACWLMLRETLLAEGRASRAAKEAVATAVSRANTCPYCAQVHGATLRALAGERTAAAVITDAADPAADHDVTAIAAWAQASARRDLAAEHPAPFPADQAADLVGVAVTFQYLNRMVNVFLGDSPLPPGVPAPARDTLSHLLGHFMGREARKQIRPGAALDLLPEGPLPGDLAWAAENPGVADAFARAAAAIETAAFRRIPSSVSELVLAELARWGGQRNGLSRVWADQAVSGLRPADRPAGRLALLTAFASYQVGQSDVEEFRRRQPGDAALIELTSWASLAAARRVGSWMGTRPVTGPLAGDGAA